MPVARPPPRRAARTADALIVLDREEIQRGRLRRYYRLTGDGVAALDAEAERMTAGADAARKRIAEGRLVVLAVAWLFAALDLLLLAVRVLWCCPLLGIPQTGRLVGGVVVQVAALAPVTAGLGLTAGRGLLRRRRS
uniref:hypothetical protein n=1 Tax=Streptomyces corallincola TaxID=2851888 RepID=UPI001FE84EEC|nr:hypothetical protein [Streptomyces corallincola]